MVGYGNLSPLHMFRLSWASLLRSQAVPRQGGFLVDILNMGRGKNDGRGHRRKNQGKTEAQQKAEDPALQQAAASFGATAMPSEVTHSDAAVFYQIVVSQSWEEVEAKIVQVRLPSEARRLLPRANTTPKCY